MSGERSGDDYGRDTDDIQAEYDAEQWEQRIRHELTSAAGIDEPLEATTDEPQQPRRKIDSEDRPRRVTWQLSAHRASPFGEDEPDIIQPMAEPELPTAKTRSARAKRTIPAKVHVPPVGQLLEYHSVGKLVDYSPLAPEAALLRNGLKIEDFDLLKDACEPPPDWRNNRRFNNMFDNVLVEIIDRAGKQTKLKDLGAKFIKHQLQLSYEVVTPRQLELANLNPIRYIRATAATHRGRLREPKGVRMTAMPGVLHVFLTEKMSMEKFIDRSKDPQGARLLLKGALAEVLIDSIRGSQEAQN